MLGASVPLEPNFSPSTVLMEREEGQIAMKASGKVHWPVSSCHPAWVGFANTCGFPVVLEYLL